jgi:hypothetical protein
MVDTQVSGGGVFSVAEMRRATKAEGMKVLYTGGADSLFFYKNIKDCILRQREIHGRS